MKKKFGWMDNVSMALVAIGGINWGLIGIANYNLVGAIFGSGAISRIIYSLVGISAVYLIYKTFNK